MKYLASLICAVSLAAPISYGQATADLSELSAEDFAALQAQLESERLRRELSEIDQQIETLRSQRDLVERRASGLPISPNVLPSELDAPELLDAALVLQAPAAEPKETEDASDEDAGGAEEQPKGTADGSERTTEPPTNSIYDRLNCS